jgi:hypothetical protein
MDELREVARVLAVQHLNRMQTAMDSWAEETEEV